MTSRMRESSDPVAGTYLSPFSHYNLTVISDKSSIIYPEDGSIKFRWNAGLHLPSYTASHPKLVIFRTTYFSRLLPQFLTAACYCSPQAAFFCNMLSFHFQNMAIAGVCWMRGNKKARERERERERERLLFLWKESFFSYQQIWQFLVAETAEG